MDVKILHELFEYRDGLLYRKKTGKEAGWNHNKGYRQARVNGNCYLVHRIIFFMFHKYLPTEIDHINGIKNDNRIENLRDVNRFQNTRNSRIRKDNTSGFKGVYWHKSIKKYTVCIRCDKKLKHFGSYDNIEDAKIVAIEARNKLHGEYANHG